MDEEKKQYLEFDNLPNRITLFRIVLIPIIVICLFLETIQWEPLLPWHGTLGWIAGWTFALASMTDFVDGYIARKRKIVTAFGSFLDPIADKFLVVSSLIMLLNLGRISVIVVITLTLREFYITSLRLFATNADLKVPVISSGKWKAATQCIGIPLLMANGHPWGIPMPLLGKILIYIATFLSLYSAACYSIGLVKKLRLKQKSRQGL